jgi:hypothetical protein
MKSIIVLTMVAILLAGCQGKGWEVAALVLVGGTMQAIQMARERSPDYKAEDHTYCCAICPDGTIPCGDLCIPAASSCVVGWSCGCVSGGF